MSTNLMRVEVAYFFNGADLDIYLEVHQLKKVARPRKSVEYLDFEELKRYTGWTGPEYL